MVIPDYLGEHSGDGLDPCAALSTHLMLSPGETVEHTYLLGYAATLDGARQLVTLATQTTADLRLAQVQKPGTMC